MTFTPPDYAKRDGGGPVLYNPAAFNLFSGPLHVSYPNFWQPLATYVRYAFARLGLEALQGFNSGNLLGFAEFTTTTDPEAETRSSSETSFLQETIENSDFTLLYQNTLADRILFNDNRTAIGVSVSTAGISYVLSARKEVVVAAGVVSTQLQQSPGFDYC